MPKLEPYSKKLSYSYALGVFPALKLLEFRPEVARRLLINPAGLENEGVIKLRERCRDLGIREEMADRILRRESKKENCFAGVVFEKFSDDLVVYTSHVVLCQISDAGNLGTSLRTLVGLGYRDVAVVRPCVDPFDPHTIRASMGAIFNIRLSIYDNFSQYMEKVGQREYYPFMLDGAVELDRAAGAACAPFTLVFGNEQSGLPSEFSNIGQPVFIPQDDAIDSYNLASAVSMGSYAFSKKLNAAKSLG